MDTVKVYSGYISGTVIGEPEKEVHLYRGVPVWRPTHRGPALEAPAACQTVGGHPRVHGFQQNLPSVLYHTPRRAYLYAFCQPSFRRVSE